MKNLVVAIGLWVTIINGSIAQDIIWKKTGEKIEAKVLKISDEEIEYKKHSNYSGPTYSVAAYDVVQITFENGEVEKINGTKQIPNANSTYISEASLRHAEPQHIHDEGGRFYVNKRKIGRRTLESWIRQLNDPETILLYNQSKLMRKLGYGLGFGSAGVAYIGLVGEFMLGTGGYILLGGGIVATAMLVTNILLIQRYKVVQSEAIQKYNEALQLNNKYDDE
ncbi:MAG: hypothetical protein JKY42_06805 [Flavobacteriales bacterium]|nr:hypothetical protein [Flavobacteriales bacterium]